jgi:hypothetical protein
VSPEYGVGHVESRPSVCGPTTAFVFFDRKENEAKETLLISFAGFPTLSSMLDFVSRLSASWWLFDIVTGLKKVVVH